LDQARGRFQRQQGKDEDETHEHKYCISVSNFSQSYGPLQAVHSISFNVEYGQVFGFLGPNGAGKTTTIKVLTTLLHPSSGNIRVFGQDIVKHSKEIRKKIGVVLQEPSFEANLTVERALDLYGMLWGLPKKDRQERIEELVDRFDMRQFMHMKNDELSIGQRRRVQVAREFMHDMDLIFLDEPTVGLDPSARRAILDYIKKCVQGGLTVFFTTHIMEEAEYLCDQIAIINRGKIIAIDTSAGLKKRYGGVESVEIKFAEGSMSMGANLQDILAAIRDVLTDGSSAEMPNANTVRISSAGAQEELVKIIGLLAKAKVQVESISINPPTLEDVFLAAIEKSKP
jgi:ABC-2 type transport system ATP-binding protein